MKRKKGFTMIESLMSLIVISMIAIIVTYIPAIQKAKYSNDTLINYHLFLNTLESDNYRFTIKSAQNGNIKLYSKEKSKFYTIRKRNNIIYLRNISSKGYVPLLNNADKLDSKIVNKHLKISVIFKNGEKHTNNLVIPYEK